MNKDVSRFLQNMHDGAIHDRVFLWLYLTVSLFSQKKVPIRYFTESQVYKWVSKSFNFKNEEL